MSERIYLEGDIWEDSYGGKWEVIANDRMTLLPDKKAKNSTKVVEGYWGPLTLKEPAEDKFPMADWERDLLAARERWASEERAKPMLFDLSEELAERLDREFVNSAVATYDEALHVLLQKNADYGSKNIAESPGGALNGLRVRMHDKFARINNLADSGVEPENESLRDSFLDLGNYCFIALMVLDGKWPGAEEVNNNQDASD